MKKANIVDWINRRFTSGSKVKKKVKEKLNEKGYMEKLRQVRAAAKGTRSEKPRSRKRKKKGNEAESIERENLLEHEHSSFRSRGSSEEDDDDDLDDDGNEEEEIDERINGTGRSSSSDSSESEDSDSDGIQWKRRRFAALESAAAAPTLPPVSQSNFSDGVDQRPADPESVDHELICEGDGTGAVTIKEPTHSTSCINPGLDNEQSFSPVFGTADLISNDGRDTLIGEQTTIRMETAGSVIADRDCSLTTTTSNSTTLVLEDIADPSVPS